MYNFFNKYKFLNFFIALTGIMKCNSEIVNAIEGDIVHLTFQYPCDSTKVTLQHSYKAPFFNSLQPNSLLLPPNHFLRNLNGTENEECSLLLEFNPVLRTDEGTYILTPYKNGQMLPDYPRVGLRVWDPPGRASCLAGDDDTLIDGEWVKLHCEAPVGHLQHVDGQIICYQNGIRLPSLNKPKENDKTLSQVILARITDPEHVRCCSSTLTETRHLCECTDWEWDPIHMYVLTNVINPCPRLQSSSILSPIQSQHTTVDNGSKNDVNTLLSKTPQANPKRSFKDSAKMKLDSISESLRVNTVLIIVALACTCITYFLIILLVRKGILKKNVPKCDSCASNLKSQPENMPLHCRSITFSDADINRDLTE